MSITLGTLLASVPTTLQGELVQAFNEIERNFRESRWEPSELNGGKLCEVVYSILKGYVDGSYPASSSKPRNMVDACRNLEQTPATFPRSVRIQIPRMLMSLYEVRNNRGVGHVGGDVDPNHMDAVCVLQMAKWILAELIRIFHNVSTQEASDVVDALSDRSLPIVWKIGGVSRILDTSMSMLNKTLVLLYSEPSGLTESMLISFLEHSNASVYRRDILRKAHKKRLIEYNETEKRATISPSGVQLVETDILR
jgi:hypothetical protein